MTTDPPGIITDVNKQMEALTGCTRDELIGAPFKNYFTDPERAEAGIRLVLSEKKVTNYELTARDRDGKETVVSYNATTFYDRDRRLQGVFAAARDITERKQYEESLREVTYKAEQASRVKSEFLANMSHEIRTPMNAVIGLSYLLGRTGLNEEQSAFLAKIKLASKSLTAVINDVLDLSKIEAGELMVERAAFSPRAVLRELADVMTVQADARGIAFEVDVPKNLPAALEGDATRLNQILTNLLSNAIKFTERGSVKLQVTQVATAANGLTLCFVAQDTGIGIAPEVLPRLFAPFSQADTSITRRFGGSGLGLSIVKRLTNLMGGEVTLESTPGVGSKFKVVLTFGLASPEALAGQEVVSGTPGDRALLGVRVLVVDDSDINLDVTKRILELEGAEVWLASNGQEAFERLRVNPRSVDVVLMDVQMPVLDGHDATRRIRLELGLTNLPIIALTAGALSSERQRAAAAGMDDFIIKPFSAEDLVRSILRHVKRANGHPGWRADGVPPALVQTPRPWPEIEGIDSADARARFGDDLNLFGTMLNRLLHEFADVSIPLTTKGLAAHGGRMHKLRGAAGMLGAKAIQALAAEAEAAAAAGDHERGEQLALRLTAELQLVRRSATPEQSGQRVPTDRPAISDDDELDPMLLLELVTLLRQHNLAATDRFADIGSQLRRRLGQESYALVRDHMTELRFTDAAKVLEEAGSSNRLRA